MTDLLPRLREAAPWQSREDGQASVEFVLVFPLVFLVVLAIVEFGFLMYSFITVDAAAREAARFAVVANSLGTTCELGTITGRAVETGAGIVQCGDISVVFVDAAPLDGEATRGDQVVVRITHPYDAVTPLAALAEAFALGTIDTSITLSACVASRLEAALPDLDGLPGVTCN